MKNDCKEALALRNLEYSILENRINKALLQADEVITHLSGIISIKEAAYNNTLSTYEAIIKSKDKEIAQLQEQLGILPMDKWM